MYFLQGSVTLFAGLLSLVPSAYGERECVEKTGKTVSFNLTLTWGDATPAGISRKLIHGNGQFPAPLLELNQGDDVEFLVINQLPVETTIHFHGITQEKTPWSDGTPGVSQRPIAPGDQFLYKWEATDYGSFFYHSHFRGQQEDGLYGPIYIHAADSIPRPFSLIAKDTADLQAMQAAEDNTTPLVLSDIRQLVSEDIWAAEEASRLDAYCANALLVNGKGSVTCLGQNTLNAATTEEQRGVLGDLNFSDIGCAPPHDALMQGSYGPYNYSAAPSSVFEGCTPSDGGIEELMVNPDTTYASFDLISAAGIAMIVFSIDEHPMYVYAIDGQYIQPTLVDAIRVPNGNRFSVLVKLDKPAAKYTIRLANTGVNQILNGTAILKYDSQGVQEEDPSEPSINITGGLTSSNYTALDETKIIPYPAVAPAQDVDETHILTVDRYNSSYTWKLENNFPLELEEGNPLLFYPDSAPTGLSLSFKNGTWVDLIIHVVSLIQPPHPIHKHSNKFFVIGQGNGNWTWSSVAEAMEDIPESFNLKNPQIRDTYATLVTPTEPSWLALRYQVVNPGAFLMHCHIQVHISGGMVLALMDGTDAWPVIPAEYQLS